MAAGADNFRIGLVAELKSQMYYASKGYEIFTPLMSQGHADFIAVKDSEVIKVQVKKATENPTDYGTYLQVRIQGRPNVHKGLSRAYDKNSFDILSIVYKDLIWNVPIELVLEKKSMTFGKINEQGGVTSRLEEFMEKINC